MTDMLAHHAEAVARGAKCRECPLYDCGQGPVMPRVVPGAAITVVGESPSTSEVETGRVLDGPAGEVVYEALKEGGISAPQVSVTGAILCRPPGGHMLDYELTLKVAHKKEIAAAKKAKRTAAPLVTPQACCQPRLERDLLESGAKTILALGSEALKAVAHVAKIPFATAKAVPGQVRIASLKKQHGSPVIVQNGPIITSAMHPAFVMYGNAKFLPVVREDIKRAAFIALRGHIEWNEPEFILKPSIDTCINVLDKLLQSKQLVTVDIETDGIDVQTTKIRCIGLGAVIDGRELIISVPLRHMDGRAWWTPGDESRLIAALTQLLETAPLNGFNLAFDTAVLLQHRILFNRAKKWADMMLGHRNTRQSELPHDLGFVAARAFEAPRWKDDADHKNVEGVDDYWLHLYNCKDVLGTMRLVEPISRQIQEDGYVSTFNVDTRLAPTARDMGDLGLNINEARRRAYFDILDVAVDKRIVELRRITGLQDFNPNASKQVSRYLYVTKGLSPPYATDGRDWAELADEDEELPLDIEDPEVILAEAATNELSLLRLLELGVDEQTRQFIEAQLAFRGLSKCRSTQLGLKWEEKEGQRVLVDVHRKRGRIHTENRGEFTGLSILHPNWKLHIIRCVALDTWVLTGEGPRQIGSLDGFGPDKTGTKAPRGFTLHDGEKQQKVSTLVNSGLCEAMTMETVLGFRLTGTPHHRIRVSKAARVGQFQRLGPRDASGYRRSAPIEPEDKWVRLDALKHGDYVKVPIGMNVWGAKAPQLTVRPFSPAGNRFKRDLKIPTEVSEDLALFAGMYTADGSLHDGNGSFTIRISNSQPKQREAIQGVMTRLFGRAHVRADATTVSVTSIALATWCEDLGLNRRIENKCIPAWVLASPWPIVAAYIRGCALDAHVELADGITPVWMYGGVERLARDMQMLLINRGIVAAVSDKRNPDGPRSWACVVTAADVAAVCSITGQTVPSPTRHGSYARPKYIRRGNNLWLRVKSVRREAKRVPMRDVTIPKTHAFWSGGCVSHNTGRWAVNPNVQAWPERIVWDVELYKKWAATGKEYFAVDGSNGIINTRAVVEAPEYYVLVGADYKAVELRLYAVQSKDALMLDAIATGKDPHALNYATMMARFPNEVMTWYDRVVKSAPSVKKYLRNIAKRFCFLEIYGGQEETLYKTMSGDRNPDGTRSFPDLKPGDVKMWHNNFHRGHPELKAWHEACGRAWNDHGFISTIIDGRRCYFLGGMDMQAIPNHSIQGSAASIANRAMLTIAEHCPHRGWGSMAGPILQVHDYIGLQVPLKRQKEAEELLNFAMPYTHNGMRFDIDLKSGRRWDET